MATAQSQRQSEDVYNVGSDNSLKKIYVNEATHECNVHMNDYLLAELGTLYTETPEDIAMEKAMSEEWDHVY